LASKRGASERFLTTVLMTDIVGSTDHAAELGDSPWRELVQVHHARVRAALRRHAGREIDTAGDGFFAVFDAPAAAVRCALEIVDEMGRLGLEIRAGVHVGEVEQIGPKVGGITVPIASRIMASAEPGAVLVSSTVRDLAAGSGLAFEDRGVRELKGVPGEWHTYLVRHVVPDSAELDSATARERRLSAVRRAGARPIWQRRPRIVVAAVVGLAIVLATSGLLIWKPWQSPALASVAENSVGIIDAGRNEIVGAIAVGTRPGGIAVEGDYAWVTNSGANTVWQIDLKNQSVTNRIEVGREPKGVAVSDGEVWVANSGERTVSRVNVAVGRVVDTIDVGNGPTAIAADGSTVWVANSTDSTVVSVDSSNGNVRWATAVAAGPIALGVDEQGLWVASEDGAVSHLNPLTGVVVAEPVRVSRPSALALTSDSVWVASVNGTVSRIDRATDVVTATVDIGGNLAAIVASGGTVWVGDRDGKVHRLNALQPATPPVRISTGGAAASLAVVDGRVWMTAHASAASHRGGTLRVVQFRPDDLARYHTDPHGNPFYNVAYLEGDGLVAYRRVGGSAGAALLPDLATSIARPTNGGLTYTFQLRPNLEYADGRPVLASDFRRTIERSFQVANFFGWAWGNAMYLAIAGTDRCTNEDWIAVERCDLSSGIQTDDAAGTVRFELTTPDPDFVYKLAAPIAYPVPDGIAMTEWVDGPFPGTGPYVVTELTASEVRLARNDNFEVWDSEVRPDGFPDEILFTVVESDADRIALVQSGEADYTSYRGLTRTSPELFAPIKKRYPLQWHLGSSNLGYIAMDTSRPPFDNADVRRAVNYAVDRAHMAELYGGQPDAPLTCQFVPPSIPGYKPYCPYTVDPDAGGSWKGADMPAAQELVGASGTRGAEILVGPTFPAFNNSLEYLASVLTQLGYVTSVTTVDSLDEVFAFEGERDITITGWSPDFVAPSNYLNLFKCGADPEINYCNPEFDAAFDHALELQATDPTAALSEWAALDKMGVDLAVTAPLYTAGGDFVSERVGNYHYNPSEVVLFDQMWVQ
jgi:YVTN family beta-propeller protein